MSACVGIDLSSYALDLVKLDEDSNRAEWVRCELVGATPWERALNVRDALFGTRVGSVNLAVFLEDVYLVAVEQPVNDQKRVLRLVQGAVIASLPAKLRQPHSCWEVHPSTWKAGLGLKGKPSVEDLERRGLMPEAFTMTSGALVRSWLDDDAMAQNARDAYCIAMYARDTNAELITAAV